MESNALCFLEPPTSDDRVVAAELRGQISVEDMKLLIEKLQAIVERGQAALLYIDMQHYEGFEFGVVAEKLKHMRMLWKAIDRYAVVGAARWMEIWIDIVDPLTPQHIEHFSPDRAAEAWDWLLSPGDSSSGV